MRKKDHPLSAAEQKLIEANLQKNVQKFTPRPEFRDELYGKLMRDFVSRNEAKATRPSSFSVLFRFGAVTAALLLFLGTTGLTTAYAYLSPSVTRESNLYFLKRTVERLQLFASSNPESQSRFHVKLAERRLEEALFLIEQGDIDTLTLEEIVMNVEEAHALASMVSDPRLKAALNEYIARAAERQRSELSLLVERVEGEQEPLPVPSDDALGPKRSILVEEPISEQDTVAITVLEKAIGDIGTVEIQAMDSVKNESPVEEQTVRQPPDLTVTLRSVSDIEHGREAKVFVDFTNIGGSAVHEGFASVTWGDGSQDVQSFGILMEQQSEIVSFAHTYRSPSTYIVRAEIASATGEERTTANNRATTSITVVLPPNACLSNGATRCDAANVQKCVSTTSENISLTWVTTSVCGSPDLCTPQGCKLACTSNCSEWSLKQCGEGGVVQCVPTPEGCLQWKHIQNCFSNQYCNSGACVTNICGNGIVESGEACDDGNTVSGDGCTACKKDISCDDTDGSNLYQRGTLTTNLSGWKPVNTDSCVVEQSPGATVYDHIASCTGNNCFVQEYLCVPSGPNSMVKACPAGCENGACKVQAAQNLNLIINGPSSRSITPTDDNVVFANVVLTTDKKLTVKKLPVLIEVIGPVTDKDVDHMMEDIELRNIATGLTMKGRAVSGGTAANRTFEAYYFENFDLPAGSHTWEVRADMRDNGPGIRPVVGDKIRVHFCAESETSAKDCAFEGIQASDQKIDARDAVTGKTVTVRPGGLVSGNFFPINLARLDISVKATASSDTATKGQKNINLLRFEARASETDDTLIYRSVFQAQVGSLSSAQNYTLWVDTDNNASVDTILQKGAAPVNGLVDFKSQAGGGYVLPKDTSVVFEVHADVAGTLLTSQLQLKFATSAPKYIGAEKANDGADLTGISTNGVCAGNCQIFVTTTDSTVWNFASQGDLFVTKSTTPVRNRQLLGGTLTDEVLRLQFHAENEDIDVTSLVLTSDEPDESLFYSNVDRIELYQVGSVTPFAVATAENCDTNPVPSNSMCASMQSQQLMVPRSSNVNVLARPRMRSDLLGAVSGKHLKLRVDSLAGVKARGLLSNKPLSQNDGDNSAEGEVFIGTSIAGASTTIRGNDNVVVLSKITSITNASPDANGTAIPTGVSRAIGQFKFSAAAANNFKNGPNKVAFEGLIFNVNATNVDLNGESFKLYNKSDPTNKFSCEASFVELSKYLVPCKTLTSTSIDTEVDPGGDITLVLEAEIRNPKMNNAQTSTLQVSLQNFGESSYSSFGPSTSHIQWIDKDAGGSTQFFWIEYPDTTVNGTLYQN